MPDPADGASSAEVANELAVLSAALDRIVPAKADDNLLVGTMNVRAFDRYRTTWRTRRQRASGHPLDGLLSRVSDVLPGHRHDLT